MKLCPFDLSEETLLTYPTYVAPRFLKNPVARRKTYLDPRDIRDLPVILRRWEIAIREGPEAEQEFIDSRNGELKQRDLDAMGLACKRRQHSRGKRNTSDQWDVRGHDVPGGRLTRWLVKGLAGLNDEARMTAKKQRRKALDRIRTYARNVEDPLDREALWALIPVIGYKGFPTWDEVVAAVQVMDLLDLALVGRTSRGNERPEGPGRQGERTSQLHTQR